MAQRKLTQRVKVAVAEVSVVEVDKATPGDPKQRCKYCDVVVKQSFSAGLVSSARGRVILPVYVQTRRRTPKAMQWPWWRRRRSLKMTKPCSCLSRWASRSS